MGTEPQQRSETQSETEIEGMLPRGRRLPTESGPSGEALVYALSHLVAAYVDHLDILIQKGMPGPRRFRAKYLADQPGHLVAPEHVAGWIDEQSKKDGLPSWWLERVAVQPEQEEEQPDGTMLVRELRYSPSEVVDGKPIRDRQYLLYSTPEFSEGKCPVRDGGTLNAVRQYSEELSYTYPWTKRQATMCVLTGMVPVLPPDAQAKDLQVRGRRIREMSVKHLELAVFTAWHRGETLAARMQQWNARFPEWEYQRPTNFGWDSQEAERRLSEREESYKERRKEAVDTRFDTNP